MLFLENQTVPTDNQMITLDTEMSNLEYGITSLEKQNIILDIENATFSLKQVKKVLVFRFNATKPQSAKNENDFPFRQKRLYTAQNVGKENDASSVIRAMESNQLLVILQQSLKSGIITLDDVVSLSEDALMNKLLQQIHPYSVFYSESDGRWHTTIADATKVSGRKPIARKKKGDLEKFLLEHYHLQLNTEQTEAPKPTFKEIFHVAEEKKLQYIKSEEKLISAKNTAIKNNSEYRRFFSGSEFENKSIDTITKKDVEEICLLNLTRYDMRKKAFASLRSILKTVFDYAFSEYWIQDNVYLRVDFKKLNNMLIEDIPTSKKAHTPEEVALVLTELHKKQKSRPKYSSYWALEMQILMGMRRGEIPPLRWGSDVSDTHISISREQLTSGNDFIIVNHTKTYKDRYFPITNDLKDFLMRLRAMHDKYYPDSEYLFPANTKTGVITNRAVYFVYQGICQQLGIERIDDVIKGPHSFRRNAITDVVNNTNGNIILASALFGNSPEVAKKNYYTNADLSFAKDVLDQRKLIASQE